MSIESDLKKDGIKVIRALDTLSVNTLADDVAEKIKTVKDTVEYIDSAK